MATLLLTTQVHENYAWGEDGTLGTGAAACWKAKSGSQYVVRNIDVNRAAEIVNFCAGQVEKDNEAFRECIVDWEIVGDDYIGQHYDGRVAFPAWELTVV